MALVKGFYIRLTRSTFISRKEKKYALGNNKQLWLILVFDQLSFTLRAFNSL